MKGLVFRSESLSARLQVLQSNTTCRQNFLVLSGLSIHYLQPRQLDLHRLVVSYRGTTPISLILPRRCVAPNPKMSLLDLSVTATSRLHTFNLEGPPVSTTSSRSVRCPPTNPFPGNHSILLLSSTLLVRSLCNMAAPRGTCHPLDRLFLARTELRQTTWCPLRQLLQWLTQMTRAPVLTSTPIPLINLTPAVQTTLFPLATRTCTRGAMQRPMLSVER